MINSCNKTNRCTNFSNLCLEWNSTCFGQFLCPSWGVSCCTHSNGICHTGLLTACEWDQDGVGPPHQIKEKSSNQIMLGKLCGATHWHLDHIFLKDFFVRRDAGKAHYIQLHLKIKDILWTQYLGLLKHSQSPRDVWKGANVLIRRLHTCIDLVGGPFEHLLWVVYCELISNRKSIAMKLETCILNVVCHIQINIFT